MTEQEILARIADNTDRRAAAIEAAQSAIEQYGTKSLELAAARAKFEDIAEEGRQLAEDLETLYPSTGHRGHSIASLGHRVS